jgi:hypothetical protein
MTAAHQPEIARLLDLCTGRGRAVLVTPAMAKDPHHFYAGITRPPVFSMLEALLLALGGTLPDGSRRYEEIVVVSSGSEYDENGADCPREEIVKFQSPAGTIERGGEWRTWWYRGSPRPAATPSSTPASAITLRPAPRLAAAASSPDFPSYPTDVPGDRGARFPNRHLALRRIIGNLQSGRRRALLLVNLAVLDYIGPSAIDRAIAEEHAGIKDVGIRDMQWLTDFINASVGDDASTLDVVFFTRNVDRAVAWRTVGLPRRPNKWEGQWSVVKYSAVRLPHIQFPCGPYPWGPMFSNDSSFTRHDGTSDGRAEMETRYHERTLLRLLRGETIEGFASRLRAGNVSPTVPTVSRPVAGLDPDYWAALDVAAVEAAFRRRYFASGSIVCRAQIAPRPALPLVDNLFAAMHRLHSLARTEPRRLADAVIVKEWRTASTILLFGAAGTGKTLLGELLCPLMFGHDVLTVSGSEVASGGDRDPGQGLKYKLFGAPNPYQGAEALTPLGQHVVQHHGFTTLIFDEFEKAIPGDLQAALSPLYELCAKRVYKPANGSANTHLDNAIIVVTANLDAWPAPGITPTNQGAVERRILPWQYAEFAPDQIQQYAEWYMVNYLFRQLDGTSVCYLSRPPKGISGLSLNARMPEAVAKALDDSGLLSLLDQSLESRRLSAATAPTFLDVAPILEDVLAG